MKKIVVTLKNGKISVDAQGFTSNSCEEATRFLQELGQVSGEEKKPEYFETPLQTEVGYNG